MVKQGMLYTIKSARQCKSAGYLWQKCGCYSGSVDLLGRIELKNEHIRGSLGIAPIDEESGLTLFEHSTRRWSKGPILESFVNESGGGGSMVTKEGMDRCDKVR